MQAGGHDWWRAAATVSSGFAVVTVVAFADGGYFRVEKARVVHVHVSVRLGYARHWERGAPARAFTMRVTVS